MTTWSVAVLLILLLSTSPARAQEPPRLLKVPGAEAGSPYLGSNICRNCHSPTATGFDDRKDFYLAKEWTVWHEQDPHSRAYDVLKGPTTARMETALGWKPGQARTEDNCLACHSNLEVKDDPTRLAEGVSCETCHGPAEAWIGPHLRPEFRTAKPERWHELRFRDVIHAPSRATLCTRCHVGDDQRKVTHAMYAAGHPPLPAFELATFLARMPRHWKDLRDMPAEVRTFRKFDEHPMTALQDVSAGSLTTLAATAAAFKPLKDAAPGSRIAAGFEAYDCASCHHELRVRDGKAARNQPGAVAGEDFFDWRTPLDPSLPPGRLRPATWAFELPAAVASLKPDALPLDGVRKTFVLDVARGRFADDPAPAAWSRELKSRLFEKASPAAPFDAPCADAFLRPAMKRGAEESLSFDSARMLAGAVRAVVRDRFPDADQKPKIAHPLQVLAETLALDAAWPARTETEMPAEGPIVQSRTREAEARAAYRPRSVRDAFADLRAAW